jgi:hypothetical protein
MPTPLPPPTPCLVQAGFMSGPLGLKTSRKLRDAPIALVVTAGRASASAEGQVAGYSVALEAAYDLAGARGAVPQSAVLSFDENKMTFSLDVSKAKPVAAIHATGNVAGTATSGSGAPVPVDGWATGLQLGVAFKFVSTVTLASARVLA